MNAAAGLHAAADAWIDFSITAYVAMPLAVWMPKPSPDIDIPSSIMFMFNRSVLNIPFRPADIPPVILFTRPIHSLVLASVNSPDPPAVSQVLKAAKGRSPVISPTPSG